MLLSKLLRISNPGGFLEKRQQFLPALQMNICADSSVNLVNRSVGIAFFRKVWRSVKQHVAGVKGSVLQKYRVGSSPLSQAKTLVLVCSLFYLFPFSS